MIADYADLEMRAAIYELLDSCFTDLSRRIDLATRAGAFWHEVSTPFVALVDGRPVSHAGVIAVPMVVGGEETTLAGVHAVCTHPEQRGRGHSRRVMEEALAHVDRHFTTAFLTTGQPELYERYGFRLVPERLFTLAGPRVQRGGQPFRPLSLDRPDDVRLLHRVLERRTPLSRVLSSRDPGWLFIIDEILISEGLSRIHYAEDLDLIAVYQVTDGALQLVDLVAPELPELPEVLGRIPEAFERVEIFFTPDLVGAGQVTSAPPPPEDYLMVRGPFQAEGELMLPPLARC